MWSKPIVLSSNYCKYKRGIVGDDEYASWEYADVMLSFVSIMISWLLFILMNFHVF